MVLILLSCAPEPVDVVVDPLALDDVGVLARASLDIRGRRPSEAEMVAVEADPEALEPLLDTFVEDDTFPERLVFLYNEVLRTRADRYLVSLDNDVEFTNSDVALAFRHSVGSEPLRLIAYVAANDLPYTDVVTADYTMADSQMLEHFPLEQVDASETGPWLRARYLDERPAVGILATSGMWWRYTSTFSNANRGRAMAIGRALLCDDRFEAAVSFQGETVNLEERISTDSACISCHSTLDPLGSYLWGFVSRNQEAWLEVTRYSAAQEPMWSAVTGVDPGFYGEPGENLSDLGGQIAADPRYVRCAVETGMYFLLNRRIGADDAPYLETHREVFLDDGLTFRSLYRSILDDPRYRLVESDTEGSSPMRSMRPDQLAASIEALTGFHWTWQGNDMMDTDENGVRVLAGGVDGVIATSPAPDPSTTTALVVERLSESAGAFAVANEATLPADSRILFQEVELDVVPDDDALVAQIQALLLRCHNKRHTADDPDVTSLAELWSALYAASGDPQTSWAMVLSAILRHPDFASY